MTVISKVLYDTILNAAPILLAVLGGIYAYKANVLNVALDGMMMMGAFVTCFVMIGTENYLLSLLLAILINIVLGLIFSMLGITMKGNVIIIGLAINMLVTASTSFGLKYLGKSELVVNAYIPDNYRITIPLVSKLPVLGAVISGHTLLTYFSYMLIIFMWLVMYKTRIGVHIRAVGENEDSVKSVGIKSGRLKYIGVTIGAVTCALGGASLSMDCIGGMFVENMTAGRGFIAIAAIYCGDGSPVRAAGFALLFGLMRSLALNLGIYISSASRIFNMFPYLIIIIVLLVVSAAKNKKNMARGKYEIQ